MSRIAATGAVLTVILLSLLSLACADQPHPIRATQEAKLKFQEEEQERRAAIDLDIHTCIRGYDLSAGDLLEVLRREIDPDYKAEAERRQIAEFLDMLRDPESRELMKACIRVAAREDPEYRDTLLETLSSFDNGTTD